MRGRRSEGETARQALIELGAVPGEGWLRQAELARLLGVASARMCILTRQLLDGGYIEKRSAGIRLSEDGKSVLAVMAGVVPVEAPASDDGTDPVRRAYVSRGSQERAAVRLTAREWTEVAAARTDEGSAS